MDDLGALRADLSGLATRGITTVADANGGAPGTVAADWAATSVTIQVAD